MADRPGAYITFLIDTRTTDKGPSAADSILDAVAAKGAAGAKGGSAQPPKLPARLNFTALENKPVAATRHGLNKLMVRWGRLAQRRLTLSFSF